jgi:hypothetical protein
MKLRYGLAVLALAFSHASFAPAQVIWINKVGDKTVTCMHSGLSSDLRDCGTRSDWYAYVFVGQISVITASEKDESEIQIRPEEVFLGKPENPMKVLTSQGWCLPNLAVGDRWLFYLRQVDGKPIVLDYYGNDSVPIANAQGEIETLRRLQKIGDFGLLRGQVMQREKFDGKVLPNAHVTAIRKEDKRQYSTIAGSDGHYEFEPLPPGEYDLKVAPIGSRTPDDSGITMKGGACWDLTLTRSQHGRIGGKVTYSNGLRAVGIDVALVSSDNQWYTTVQTDEKGGFQFDPQQPGEFVLGFNFPPKSTWVNFGGGAGAGIGLPPMSWFYPGVPNRSSARVIELKTDEKLDDIRVILPAN